jgi:hypothetical protein
MTTPTLPGAAPRPVRTRSDKAETAVLVLILATVGLAAGAASFTHVHDWTMHNSPEHTGSWFGWANACISELVPIAALLVMRRRRRTGQPVAYPASLLVGALVLSVTAQLAVARPTFFGGVVSVVPALAFAALAKLILGKTTTPAAAVGTDAPRVIVPAVPDRPPAPPPAAAPVPDLAGLPTPATGPATDARPPATQDDTVPAGQDVITNVPGLSPTAPDRPRTVPPLPAATLDAARRAAAEHQQRTGRPITRDELRAALRVSNSLAGDLLAAIRAQPTPVNGRPAPALIGTVTR